jgi:uncharacterized membrane protein YphA (DoxX/SURF4 family)
MPHTHVVREVKVVRTVEPAVGPVPLQRRPSYQAYQLLRFGYAILPIIAGVDKFFHWLTSWEMYLSSSIEKILPIPVETFMRISGAVEIAAGVLVAIAPRIGAWVVAAWLAGITLNLLLPPGYYDIALRDFGLMIGAISLGLLSRKYRK